MEIFIGDRYRISSDIYSIQLDEKKIAGDKAKNTGEERWSAIGWYANIGQALNNLATKHLNKSEAKSVKELKDVISKFMDDVNASKVVQNSAFSPVVLLSDFLE